MPTFNESFKEVGIVPLSFAPAKQMVTKSRRDKERQKRNNFEKSLKPGLVFSFFVTLWLRVGCGFA